MSAIRDKFVVDAGHFTIEAPKRKVCAGRG
jgi:hypothetical protein